MKIGITSGAKGFLKPLVDCRHISNVYAVRDRTDIESQKLKYYHPYFNRITIIKNINKLLLMIFKVPRGISVLIGIYEIPHGLIAFISGLFRRKPVIISLIGNPGYKEKRKGLWKVIMYFMLKRVKYITVTGSRSKKILAGNGLMENKIYVLPNAIDNDLFRPRPVNKEYDVITLGRLSLEKNMEFFIEVIVKLKSKKPEIKAAIAGTGPFYVKLNSLIKQHSMEDIIDILGFVDDSVDYYNSGRIFLLTSITEGLPRTVAEAMACGIPCVSSDVGDISDIVEDNVNGFILSSFDANEYANRIEDLLDGNGIYNQFSEAAMKKIDQEYSFKAATRTWGKILNQLKYNTDVK